MGSVLRLCLACGLSLLLVTTSVSVVDVSTSGGTPEAYAGGGGPARTFLVAASSPMSTGKGPGMNRDAFSSWFEVPASASVPSDASKLGGSPISEETSSYLGRGGRSVGGTRL